MLVLMPFWHPWIENIILVLSDKLSINKWTQSWKWEGIFQNRGVCRQAFPWTFSHHFFPPPPCFVVLLLLTCSNLRLQPEYRKALRMRMLAMQANFIDLKEHQQFWGTIYFLHNFFTLICSLVQNWIGQMKGNRTCVSMLSSEWLITSLR